MANYSILKGDINDTVKTNGSQSISGAALNTILNEMVTSLGAGYNYMGVAVPTTNPGTPDPNVFYLASQAGTYTNFGGIVVNDGEVCALVYNGSWSKQVTGAATKAQLSQLGQEVGDMPMMVAVNQGTTYNDNHSITISALYIKREKDDTWVNLGVSSNTYYPITGAFAYVLSESNNTWTISAKASANIVKGDIILLHYNSSHVVYGGALYTDYINKRFGKYLDRNKTLVSCSSTTTYNEETGDIYVGNINVFDSEGGVVNKTFNQSYTLLSGVTAVQSYVLAADGNIVCRTIANIVASDLVLLTYSPSQKTFLAGLIFPDFIAKKGTAITVEIEDAVHNPVHDIYPVLKYEQLKRNGTIAETYYGKNVLSTPRFIKNKKNFSITSNVSCLYNILFFDASFTLINDTTFTSISADTTQNITVPTGCCYIKLTLKDNAAASNPIPLIDVKLTGQFEDEVYNIRPSDGYQRIIVPVNVTNPTCCDTITDYVQDREELLPDYGILALPEQYSNTGKPTRLIIYCHGAAVNYASDVTRFNSTDLEPDYWLAEGYAVMDVEGNPYNNEDEHFYIPQASECYIAAYKWVLEHYNVRRDGVFLGGRSMGGEMTFELLRRECCIPVIAGCPNATAPVPSHLWNYMNAQRRAFCALHMGFIIPTDYTTYPWAENFVWTSDSPMTNAEWACLQYNYKILAKYTPVWNMILDLKDANTMLNSDMNVSKSTVNVPKELEAYTALHAAVKAPIKLFAVLDDTSSIYERATYLYKTMFENSGQLVETRLFQSGGHHYDTQNPDLRADITTRYGEQLTDIPVVYIEMLQFWRRYEQEN